MLDPNPQIGAKPKEIIIPGGKLTGWRQEKYYQRVVYSDFLGVDEFTNDAVEEGFVSSPHDKKGNYRLFGDGSARWIHVTMLEKEGPEWKGRKISSMRPSDDQMVKYWEILDRN
jgi:hypothetical protein